ncbi:hypothetical protein MKW94_029394, partial [Papaver nudicaule]|nr:hypothetical protein [Papaver nudicaule]
STGSFFHDKSITLGSLIGVSSILEFSRRSIRGGRAESMRKNVTSPPPSLGHFLQVERKAANSYRRNQRPMPCEHGEFVQPDQTCGSEVGRRHKRSLSLGCGCGAPVLLSCMRGQPCN